MTCLSGATRTERCCNSAPHLDSHQLVLVQPAVHHSIAALACMQRHVLLHLSSWAATSTATSRPSAWQPGAAWVLSQPQVKTETACEHVEVAACAPSGGPSCRPSKGRAPSGSARPAREPRLPPPDLASLPEVAPLPARACTAPPPWAAASGEVGPLSVSRHRV